MHATPSFDIFVSNKWYLLPINSQEENPLNLAMSIFELKEKLTTIGRHSFRMFIYELETFP